MADERRETPSLAKVMQDMIDKHLMDVHTSMPGLVVSYDFDKNLAVIQPALQRKFKNSESQNLPLISNVPIYFPGTSDSHIRFPIKAGDEGTIIFQERSIDRWASLGGTVDTLDTRKFHLSDAIFLPGKLSQVKKFQSKAKKTSIEIKNGKSWIEILPNGKFKFTDGADEVLLIIRDFLVSVNEATTETLLGPQYLIPPAIRQQWLQLIDRIEKLRSE